MVQTEAENLVLRCLAAVLGEDSQLTAAEPDTAFVLMGPHSGLDSIKLVELIADVEQTLEGRYGITVQLADERALSQQRNPYRSVSALAEYICMLALEQQSHVDAHPLRHDQHIESSFGITSS